MKRLQTRTTAALLLLLAGASSTLGQPIYPPNTPGNCADGPETRRAAVATALAWPGRFDECVVTRPCPNATQRPDLTLARWSHSRFIVSTFLNNFRLISRCRDAIAPEEYGLGIYGRASATAAASINVRTMGSDGVTDCMYGDPTLGALTADVTARCDIEINTTDPTRQYSIFYSCPSGGQYYGAMEGRAYVAAYTGPVPRGVVTPLAPEEMPLVGGETHVLAMSESVRRVAFFTSYKDNPDPNAGCEPVECAVDSLTAVSTSTGEGSAILTGPGTLKFNKKKPATLDIYLWADGPNTNSRYNPPFPGGDSDDPYWFSGVCSSPLYAAQPIVHPPSINVVDVIGLNGSEAARLLERFVVSRSANGSISAWRANVSGGPSSTIPSDTPVLIRIPVETGICERFSVETSARTVDPVAECLLSPDQLDIDGDGMITYNDRYEISSRLGQLRGSPGYIDRADVLFDGTINLADYQQYSICWAGAVPCFADIAGPGQGTSPDGVLTADDMIVFFNRFFSGDLRVDVAGPGQSTVPDGQLTSDDIIVFLNRFFAGCATPPATP
jgi:hypothetical protein